jgi:Rap1a immunity proteins
MSGVHHMKSVFAGVLGAGLALATPISAKFIGTMYYMPDVMLEMCKSDIARGQAGFCTGYVIATWERMAGAGEVCTPQGIEYEDMLRAVVDRLEVLVKENIRVAISLATEGALRLTWPCKK